MVTIFIILSFFWFVTKREIREALWFRRLSSTLGLDRIVHKLSRAITDFDYLL